MADLLVKLYDFKMPEEASAPKEIRIFRPMTPDRKFVTDFVRENFGGQWASECETAFFDFPVRMWVAADGKEIVGFACYECTCRGFFGPTGVAPAYRRKGIGKLLLWHCLEGLKELGYAYAVIGGVEKKNYGFYSKTCGAAPIEGSDESIYKNLL